MIIELIGLLKTLGILNIFGLVAMISSPAVAFVFWQNSNMRKEFRESFVTKDEYDKDIENAKINIIKPITNNLRSIREDLKSLSDLLVNLGNKIERHDATIEAYINQKDKS